MPLPKALARFNRHVTNRVGRLVAGWLPPFAIVWHRGRKSGHEYRTPIWAFRTEDGYVVALTYGARSDWVRNVVAASGCRIQRAGRLMTMLDPRVVNGIEGMRLVPVLVRWPLRLIRVSDFLRLSVDPGR